MPLVARFLATAIALYALVPTLGSAAPFAEIATRDAALHALEFVDAGHGFAVGDRGVVLRTDDGGRSWTPLDTPVDCTLYGVSFVDRMQGWAVGGTSKPFSSATRGIVLRTTDGGATWASMPDPTLPLLRWVRFFDKRNGVAVGAGEAFHPSGVFVTSDGGRSWQPLPGDRPRHWRAAAFFTPEVGIAVADRGSLGLIAKRQLQPLGGTAGDRRGYHAVQIAGPTTAWAVGDGGAVLKTSDAGRSWKLFGEDKLGAVASCDWRVVATRGDHVWVAGSPGSVVLHSPDGGQTWRRQATGSGAPIHAIAFADHRRGWAVGALGTILSTDDGGQTWRVQRRESERVAFDVLLADPRDTPVDLFAKVAAAEGYLASTATVFGEAEGRLQASVATRIHESTVAAGGTLGATGWRLWLEPSERGLPAEGVLAALDRQTDGRAREELVESLVTRFRTLRPSAIVVVDPEASASPGAAELLAGVVEQAVRDAADPKVMPEHYEVSLKPWRVERVVQLTADGLRSTGGFATGDFEPQLGTSVAQWASGPRRLVKEAYVAPPSRVGWRTVVGNAESTRRDDLLAGIALPRGGEARRPAATPPAGNLDQLRNAARKRNNMQQLLAKRQGDSAWAGQVVNLTGGLDADSGGELLYQLAVGYRDAGKLDLAADTFYLLAKRYQNHPLTEPALSWLLRYYASSEMAVHASATAKSVRSPQPLANVAAGPAGGGTDFAWALKGVVPAGDAQGTLSDDDRFERATRLAKYLRDARPALFADPALRFPVVAAKRRLGYEKDAQRILLLLGKQAIDPAWRRCADAERWLAKPSELPPEKLIAVCKSTAERPLLDGELNDACWSGAERVVLKADPEDSRDAPELGVLRFVRDEAFLYLAIDCPMVTGAEYAAPASGRSRDADLGSGDRVTLRFDTDRDYTSAFELTIDAQGRPNDRVVGGQQWADRRWDPSWYIACVHAEGRWRVEAAVPLSGLASSSPTPRDVWAVGAVRHTPGSAGRAAWAGAEPDSPDHYGLLLMR